MFTKFDKLLLLGLACALSLPTLNAQPPAGQDALGPAAEFRLNRSREARTRQFAQRMHRSIVRAEFAEATAALRLFYQR